MRDYFQSDLSTFFLVSSQEPGWCTYVGLSNCCNKDFKQLNNDSSL